MPHLIEQPGLQGPLGAKLREQIARQQLKRWIGGLHLAHLVLGIVIVPPIIVDFGADEASHCGRIA
jgi:hypothetical protein